MRPTSQLPAVPTIFTPSPAKMTPSFGGTRRAGRYVLYRTDSDAISAHTPSKPGLRLWSSRFTEDTLHRTPRYLSFVFLAAALTASAAPKAATAQEVVVTQGGHTRYYDRNHHDYHEWNDREDRSYRIYLGEHHRDYREFRLTTRRQQDNYWTWRHNHPDHN